MILMKITLERQALKLYQGNQPNGIKVGKWTEAGENDGPKMAPYFLICHKIIA